MVQLAKSPLPPPTPPLVPQWGALLFFETGLAMLVGGENVPTSTGEKLQGEADTAAGDLLTFSMAATSTPPLSVILLFDRSRYCSATFSFFSAWQMAAAPRSLRWPRATIGPAHAGTPSKTTHPRPAAKRLGGKGGARGAVRECVNCCLAAGPPRT